MLNLNMFQQVHRKFCCFQEVDEKENDFSIDERKHFEKPPIQNQQ